MPMISMICGETPQQPLNQCVERLDLGIGITPIQPHDVAADESSGIYLRA